MAYSFDDDEKILKFLTKDKRYLKMGGRSIWKLAEIKKITTHSWQSMKDRFRRYIFKNLKSYGFIEASIVTAIESASSDDHQNVIKRKGDIDLLSSLGLKKKCQTTSSKDDKHFIITSSSSSSSNNDVHEKSQKDGKLCMADGGITNEANVVTTRHATDSNASTDMITNPTGISPTSLKESPALSTSTTIHRADKQRPSACLQEKTKIARMEKISNPDVDQLGEDSDSSTSSCSTIIMDLEAQNKTIREFLEDENIDSCEENPGLISSSIAEKNSKSLRRNQVKARTVEKEFNSEKNLMLSEEDSDAESADYQYGICSTQFQLDMEKLKLVLEWLDIPSWVLNGALYLNNGDLDDAIYWLINNKSTKSGRLAFNHKDDKLLLRGSSDDLKALELKYGKEGVQRRLNFVQSMRSCNKKNCSER